MQAKRLILVLGMHRSGTSAITRGLQAMGVSLGDRLLPPGGDNPTGYWEDRDVFQLNVDILDSIGATWDDLIPITLDRVEALKSTDFLPRAIDLLQHKFLTAELVGIKEPRLTKLLPFWIHVFRACNLQTDYIIAIRHPLSVAKSLAVRNALPPDRSYLLWLTHIIPSLSETQTARRVLVDYDRLMQTPNRELQRIANLLDLTLDPRQVQSYELFLDAALRHTLFTLNDLLLDTSCPSMVQEIYPLLLDSASTANDGDSAIKAHLPKWLQQYYTLATFLPLCDRSYNEQAALNQRLAFLSERCTTIDQALHQATAQIATFRQSLAATEERISFQDRALFDRDAQLSALRTIAADGRAVNASLDRSLSEREDQILSLQHALAAREDAIEDAAKALREREANIANLARGLQSAASQIDRLIEDTTEKDWHINSLTQTISDRSDALAKCQQINNTLETTLSRMTASASWRFTAPFRVVKLLILRLLGDPHP